METSKPYEENDADMLNDIVGAMAEAVISVDGEKNIILFNRAAQELFGYTAKDMIGHPVAKILAATILNAKPVHESRENSRVILGLTKNSRSVPLNVRVCQYDKNNTPHYMVFCSDVSERLEQKTDFQNTDAKFQALFNFPGHFVILMKNNGEITDFSEYAMAEISSDAQKYKGQLLWRCDFWSKEKDCQRVEQEIVLIKQGSSSHFMVHIKDRCGAEKIFDMTVRNIHTDEGGFLLARGTDVTSSIAVNKSLVEAENRLFRIEHSARTGSWQWYVRTNEVDCSDEIWRILAHSPKSKTIAYNTLIDWIHVDDRKMVEEIIGEALSDGRPYSTICRIINHQGTEKTVKMKGEVVCTKDGTPIQMVGTMQDISEKWQMEQELLIARMAGEGTRFFAAKDHDVATSLQADMPLQNSRVLPVNFQARAFLDICLFMAEAKAQEKRIKIETSISASLGALYLDPKQTSLALVNLLENAISTAVVKQKIKISIYEKATDVIFEIHVGRKTIREGWIKKIFSFLPFKGAGQAEEYDFGIIFARQLAKRQEGQVNVQKGPDGDCKYLMAFPRQVVSAKTTKTGRATPGFQEMPEAANVEKQRYRPLLKDGST